MLFQEKAIFGLCSGTRGDVPGAIQGPGYPKCAPAHHKDVQSFLGFIGHYHRLIPHFASLAYSLIELTKGKKEQKHPVGRGGG